MRNAIAGNHLKEYQLWFIYPGDICNLLYMFYYSIILLV